MRGAKNADVILRPHGQRENDFHLVLVGQCQTQVLERHGPAMLIGGGAGG